MANMNRAGRPTADAFAAAIEMAQAMTEIVKNPDAVKEAAQILVDANTMSEARKAEAEQAAKNVLDSKEIQVQLEKQIKEHHATVVAEDARIAKDKADTADQRVGLANEQAAHEAIVAAHNDLVLQAESQHKEEKKKLDAQAVALADGWKQFNASQAKLQEEKATHERNVADLEIRSGRVTAREKKLRDAVAEESA